MRRHHYVVNVVEITCLKYIYCLIENQHGIVVKHLKLDPGSNLHFTMGAGWVTLSQSHIYPDLFHRAVVKIK